MDIRAYSLHIDIANKTEIERVKYIAYYIMNDSNDHSFNFDVVCVTLENLGHPISNKYRIKKTLCNSRDFRKNTNTNNYMFASKIKAKMDEELDGIVYNSEFIISDNSILNENIFLVKLGYLNKLIKQINNTYTNKCYDACAVIMRRLFEICLILCYEHQGIDTEIRDSDGQFLMLERIVANAKNNTTLKFSRIKNYFDKIRDLGNFAAHRITYNISKQDIDDLKMHYRVCLEELYYKSGLKE